jgi:hypothetical protein
LRWVRARNWCASTTFDEATMAKNVTEAQLRVATLKLLGAKPSGFMTTSDLIAELGDVFQPEGRDAMILQDRSDTYFSQKVRNMISHRTNSTSLMKRGLAKYHKDREGLELTEAGRVHLDMK